MAGGHELKKTVYCKKSDFQMDNIGIIFILQIIGQRGVTNEIISIFNMLLYQPIGELYYFNIPLVKYLNTGKVIEYIIRDRLQVVYTVSQYTRLCTEKVIVYIQSTVYTTSLYISECIFQKKTVYWIVHCISCIRTVSILRL